MRKVLPVLPGPYERWKPKEVDAPPPPDDSWCWVGAPHRFLYCVGAVRYNTGLEARRGRFVRTVSNAVRKRLLRLYSLYVCWRGLDFQARSTRSVADRFATLFKTFQRSLREQIVRALAYDAGEQEMLWQLVRSPSTTSAKKTMNRPRLRASTRLSTNSRTRRKRSSSVSTPCSRGTWAAMTPQRRC